MKGFTIAPIFMFRSPLPVRITEGLDINGNSERNDLPAKAYKFDGFGNAPEGDRRLRDLELQPRRVADADEPARVVQLPALRHSRSKRSGRCSTCSTRRTPRRSRPTRSTATGAPEPDFMQPTDSGDFQEGEQRVGQIGFRFTF